MNEIENHPLAEIFPMIGNGELAELAEDIKKNGLKNPVVLFEGKILDGRNRYRACEIAGVKPDFVEYAGSEPLQHIISLNLHRRHLSESQRAMVAAKITNLEPHRPPKNNSANLRTSQVSQPQAATLLNISERSVQAAKSIIKKAPDKVAAIERGEKTIHKATVEMKKPLSRAIKQERKSVPHGSYENWQNFKSKGGQILSILDGMKDLRPDIGRMVQARELIEKIQTKLEAVLKQLN